MAEQSLRERAERIGALLASHGGIAPVGVLQIEAGMSHNTIAKAMNELRSAGLVERIGGSRGTPQLTAAGRTRFAGEKPISAGVQLDAAIAVWPEPHAAFLRLYISSAISRWHLGQAHPEAHLGFIAVGEPRTGKSALHAQGCHLLGRDPETHTRDLAMMSEGEVLGRRAQDGAAGWTFVPATTLELPLVLLDEFDKAPSELRARALLLCQGKARAIIEGAAHHIRPTPMVAANLPPAGDDRFAQIPDAYRRRSVLLDTGYSRGTLDDLGPHLREYYRRHAAGALRLDDLVPPLDELPDHARASWSVLRDMLSETHRHQFPDERALDMAALGRAALMGISADDSDGLALAAVAVAVDYVACAGTVRGLLHDGVMVDLAAMRDYYGGRTEFPSVEAAVIAQQQTRAQAAAVEATVRQARDRTSNAVLASRSELAERLRLAVAAIDARKMPTAHKPAAAAIRAVLRKSLTSAQHVQRPDHLTDLTAIADEQLRAATALAQRVESERIATQTAKIREGQEAQEAKRAAAALAQTNAINARDRRRRLKAELTQHRIQTTDLEKLYARTTTRPGENPFVELRKRGLVAYRPTRGALPRKGFLARLAAPPPAGEWVSTSDAGVGFPGRVDYCAALASWGAATRDIIAPSLRQAHAHEDSLCRSTRAPARRSRPVLPPAERSHASVTRTAVPYAQAKYNLIV